MLKNLFIKKLMCATMLVVFSISITPTIIFHDLFANHTDTARKISDNGKEQVGKKLFNCNCDDIVAESPFTEPAAIIFVAPEQFFAATVDARQIRFPSSIPINKTLRGPPAV